MRLTILLFLCFFPFLSTSYAQKNNFSFGVTFSPSVEGFYKPEDPNNRLKNKKKASYNFGLKTRYFASNRIGISSGLMIYNKGRAYTSSLAPIPGQTYNFVWLSSSIWYLTIPLNLQIYFPLPNQNTLSSNIGFTFGRKVFQYFHQIDPQNNFYTIATDASSNNHLALVLGLSYAIQIRTVTVEMMPCYIRQLNSGWEYRRVSKPKTRFDSYLLELTFYGLLKKKR